MLEPLEEKGYGIPRQRSSKSHVHFIIAEAAVMTLIIIYILLLEFTDLLNNYDGDEYGMVVGAISAMIGGHHFILGAIQAWRSDLGGIRKYMAGVLLYLMYPISILLFRDFLQRLIIDDGQLAALCLILPIPILAWWMAAVQHSRWKSKKDFSFIDAEDILDA